MIKRFLRSSAVYPNDLVMLQRVFDRCCTDGGLTQLSMAAEFEAATLLNLFQNGVTDEDALLVEMHRRQSDNARRAG